MAIKVLVTCESVARARINPQLFFRSFFQPNKFKIHFWLPRPNDSIANELNFARQRCTIELEFMELNGFSRLKSVEITELDKAVSNYRPVEKHIRFYGLHVTLKSKDY